MKTKRIKTEMLFKLSNLNSNLALTLGYLNPPLEQLGGFQTGHQTQCPVVSHVTSGSSHMIYLFFEIGKLFLFFSIFDQVKNQHLQTGNYNCQIKYFTFCEHF